MVAFLCSLRSQLECFVILFRKKGIFFSITQHLLLFRDMIVRPLKTHREFITYWFDHTFNTSTSQLNLAAGYVYHVPIEFCLHV